MEPSVDTARAAPAPPETVVFSATLSPHRSLGPQGFFLVMGFFTIVSVMSAAPFIMMGAWPVGGFFGLDLLLLYICFRINNREARQYEQVLLSRLELVVRKVFANGDGMERRFNPFWIRLEKDVDPDYGMTRLALVQRREEIEIGAFLAPYERADFAEAFGRALAEAKR